MQSQMVVVLVVVNSASLTLPESQVLCQGADNRAMQTPALAIPLTHG